MYKSHLNILNFRTLNELLGVYHIKYYLFDDNVIISGANLADHYFENRRDRYVLIKK